MQRDISVTFGIVGVILVIAIFSFSRASGNSLSLSQNNAIPTSAILGATAQPVLQTATPTQPLITPTPSVSVTITPTITKIPTSTPSLIPPTTIVPTQELATCATPNIQNQIKIKSTSFMAAHDDKDAEKVLGLIYNENTSDPDLDYWLGADDNYQMRLYTTATTNYDTVSFKPGLIISKGSDNEIRGAKRCQIEIKEERQTTLPDQTFSKTTVTRYIDFALEPDGNLTLVAFKDTPTGKKYSGFN